ncbi:MAG: DUF120 domain-containing protein [Thermoplasmata archaeon]
MEKNNLCMLKQIALMSADEKSVATSSRELGKILAISQQSASKKILDLVNCGLIERKVGAKKQILTLTEKGWQSLQREYLDYQSIFQYRDRIKIRGEVTSGLGEGKYYLSQSGYISQFKDKLKFTPFKGTLNVKIKGRETDKLSFLHNAEGVQISDFQNGNRTFGGAKCFFGDINNYECAVVLPNRSHYSDVIEIVSRHQLRKVLNLKDGDIIEINVKT